MQPTEHKQPTEEELIAHIRQGLMAHEEPYKEGAWEKFNEREPKKRPIFWIGSLSGVAALLAICFTLFLLTNKKTKEPKVQFTQTEPSKTSITPDAKPNIVTPNGARATFKNELNESKNALVKTQQEEVTKTAPIIAKTDMPVIPKGNDLPVNIAGTHNDQNVQALVVDAIVKAEPPIIAKNIEEKEKPTIIEFLTNETKKNQTASPQNVLDNKESKWALGVVIAPSFGNSKKLNMGYGLSMGYNLSEKLALTSGIAYNEMNASKSVSAAATSSQSLIVSDAKNLESVNEKVAGIDIPLEIKYHINKNVYANFGVSAFAVFNQKRNNNYVESVVVYSATNGNALNGTGAAGAIGIGGSATGGQFSNSYVINQRSSEPVAEKKQDNYLAFYNLSFGYRKKISKYNSVAFEPFLKLPIKETTKNDLKLVGAGMRLKFDF